MKDFCLYKNLSVLHTYIYIYIYTVGYARTNMIGSRTLFIIASVRYSIH